MVGRFDGAGLVWPQTLTLLLYQFSFCKGYKSCLKRKGLDTNATDLRQNSADQPFNLSLCGFC